MILLDTNVLSALLRLEREPTVVDWLNTLDETDLCTAAVSVFELRFGIERLPASRRRSKLDADFGIVLAHVIGNRVLPFDRDSAVAAAGLRARRGRSGKTIDVLDTQIAGIAIANECAVATRNVRHFADLAIELIDPWAVA